MKQKLEPMPKGPSKNAIIYQINRFTQKNQSSLSTDYFNFYSSGQAIQYSLLKPNSPYVQTADKIMNSSGGSLKIVMKGEEVKTVPTWDSRSKAPRLPWQCHGGCYTGITEDPDGTFKTTFRDNRINPMKTSEVTALFGSKPTSFGALKALNVYTIKNCAGCKCLNEPGKSLDSILSGPDVIKTSIDKLSKDKDGKESFVQDIGKIEQPENTCIFTPPVAHTCKQDPQGAITTENKNHNPINFSCPFWHKKVGLEKTMNFVNEVLMVPESATSGEQCRLKVKTFEESIHQSNAICEQTIPDEVPVNCK